MAFEKFDRMKIQPQKDIEAIVKRNQDVFPRKDNTDRVQPLPEDLEAIVKRYQEILFTTNKYR